ncbi:MAG: hypothetical protein HN348_15905, partial [Proteobacteria bacterium]|nr:hypothetical protein [Pseudomonadota bacterium]
MFLITSDVETMYIGSMERLMVKLLIPLLLVMGCKNNDDDSGVDTDVDDTDTDDTDTDDTDDTDTVAQGMSGIDGGADCDGLTYDGWEELFLIGDEGKGDDICRLQVELDSVGVPRADCDICTWAFDLEVTAASIVVESESGCAAYLGIDSSNVGNLVGTTRAYGYTPNYFG